MTWEQFLEWRALDELEPFGEERADFRSAHIVQTLWNIARDQKKNPNGWPITDFLLTYGDSPYRRTNVKQSLETQEEIIDAWVTCANAIHREARHP